MSNKLSEQALFSFRKKYRFYLTLCLLIFKFFSISTKAQSLSGHLLLPTKGLTSEVETKISLLNPIKGLFSSDNGTALVIPGDIPVQLDPVSYEMKWGQSGFLRQLKKDSITYQLNNAELSAEIPRLKIDTTLVRIINGITFNIKVKSNCTNIKMSLTSNEVKTVARLASSYKDKKLSIKATIADISYSNPVLTVNEFDCDNIEGIEELLKSEIQKQVSQLDLIKPALVQRLDSILNQEAQSWASFASNLLSNKIGNEFNLSLSNLNDDIIDIEFSTESIETPNEAVLSAHSFQNSSEAQIILNKSELEAYSLEKLKLNLQKKQISSKDIPELHKLTKSRFLQFFIWPALMKRKKGAELLLYPTVENLSLVIEPNKEVTSLEINSTSGLWITDNSEPMVYLRSQISAESKLDSVTGLIQSKLNKFKTKSIWDEVYLKIKNVSKRIATGIIDQVAKSFFNDTWAKSDLNFLQITNETSASIDRFYLDESDTLYLSVKIKK